MNEIDHFKFFVLCSGDVAADVDRLYVKRIYLVSFFYIVLEDSNNYDGNRCIATPQSIALGFSCNNQYMVAIVYITMLKSIASGFSCNQQIL
jgi:hypothetical protein